jgi:hypothetical protein
MVALPNTFLTPTSPPPPYDDALDDVLTETVVGITGLAPQLVRPRWQPDPPPQPAVTVDWCALGVTATDRDVFSSTVHDGRGEGSSTEYRCEEHTVTVSFYGPRAEGYAALLQDGFGVEPNRYALQRVGIAFVRCGPYRNASFLVATENLRRFDLDFQVRRRVARTYDVRNVRKLDGAVVAEGPFGAGNIDIVPIDVG